MSRSKSKVVDLEINSDGTYSSKTVKTKAIAKTTHHKENIQHKDKHKNMVPSGADEFLGGIDSGLDFVENVRIRALRILRLWE